MHAQFRFKNYLLLLALSAAYPAVSHAAGAARVEFVSGEVFAVSSAGAERALNRGAELASGETIRTGDNARAQLRFSDGAMMSLQPQTEFRIDSYNYNGKADGQEKGFFSLIKGGLRTITGLIGKGQRDNYRVNTAVATIGIRGTEYSAQFSGGQDGVLKLSTGEGRVEVCNAGGCVIAAGGESAIVTGTTAPAITTLKPTLSAAPVIDPPSTLLTYAAVENVDNAGMSQALGATAGPLVSGPGYAVAFADDVSGLVYASVYPGVTASFDGSSRLLSFTDGDSTLTADTVASSFSLNGVLGWGVWSSGTQSSGSTPFPLSNLHYVVGKPTDSSELSALAGAGVTASYSLVGYTAPTSSAIAGTGSNVSASLAIDFGTAVTNLSLSFNFAGVTHNTGNVAGSLDTSSGTISSSDLSTTYSGLVAGPNAAYAGIAYTVDGTGSNQGTLSGALAFKKQ